MVVGLSCADPTMVDIILNAPLTAHVATLYCIEKYPTVDTQVIVAPFLIFTLLPWGSLSSINSHVLLVCQCVAKTEILYLAQVWPEDPSENLLTVHFF